MINEIRESGIAISGEENINLGDYVLIMDLLAVIRYFIYPDDCLNLAALLQSKIFEFSRNDIEELCIDRDKKLAEIILEDKKYLKVKEKFEIISDLLLKNNICEFYQQLIQRFDLLTKYQQQHGEFGKFLLKEFLKICKVYNDQDGNYFEFLKFFARNEVIVRTRLSASSEIRIRTMHGAKGLEAEYVFLALAEGGSERDKLIIDYKNNFIFSNLNKFPTKISINRDYNLALKAEERRLLYVALTRSKQELHIFQIAKEKKGQKLEISLLEDLAQNNKNFIKQDSGYIYQIGLDQQIQEKSIEAVRNNVEISQQENSDHDRLKKILLEYNLEQDEVSESDQSVLIGNIYHQIFYILAQYQDFDNLDKKINKIIDSNQPIISNDQKIEIIDKTKEILKDKELKHILFTARALNEKEFAIKNNDKVRMARIDRILISGENIRIIDYKLSNNQLLFEKYQKQLDFYQSILSQIYPEFSITKSLFFIKEMKLVDIN